MMRWKICSGRKMGAADKQDPDVPPKGLKFNAAAPAGCRDQGNMGGVQCCREGMHSENILAPWKIYCICHPKVQPPKL